MTQALAAYNNHGIVLATDSLATSFLTGGQTELFNVAKLFPCGEFAAVLSGGAGVSVPLSQALAHQLLRRQGLLEPDDLVAFSLEFLSRGYERHWQQHGLGPEELQRIYFILAAYFPESPPPGFHLVLLGSDDGKMPLRLMSTGNLIVMPRNLGMEMRLFKALLSQTPLEEILRLSREFLEKQADLKEEVGPPFYYATITPAGYQPVAFP